MNEWIIGCMEPREVEWRNAVPHFLIIWTTHACKAHPGTVGHRERRKLKQKNRDRGWVEALLYNVFSLIWKLLVEFSPSRKIFAPQLSPSPVPRPSSVKRTLANLCLLPSSKRCMRICGKQTWEQNFSWTHLFLWVEIGVNGVRLQTELSRDVWAPLGDVLRCSESCLSMLCSLTLSVYQ